MTPRVQVGGLDEIQRAAVSVFERAAHEAVATRGRFITALPGGSVAQMLFPPIATSDVDWLRTDIFWIDERAVPPDHADSNYAIASRLLLGPARVPDARVHRLHGELPDLAQAARRDADELKAIAGDPPRLDLALVGIGEDGHVASIFPGRRGGAARTSDAVMPVYDAPKPPARRLTLTMPVLTHAGCLLVAAFGTSKAGAIRDAMAGSGTPTPLADLLRAETHVHLLLDREAAELLS
jgi:6-phosphogluconolactonase